MLELNKIYCEDCLETLKRMPDNFVDSIVTDPPYGLEFMGKEWDAPWKDGKVSKEFNTSCEGKLGGFKKLPNHSRVNNLKCLNCGKWKFSSNPCKCENPIFPNARLLAMKSLQNWYEQWAKECLRVLKPGGHLLAFGGTRTYHRMACAIEDAGFEIRDQIQWIYGSGFPKSLDVSKAIDKMGYNQFGWIEFSKAYKKIVEESNYTHNDIDKYLGIKSSSCYWARIDYRGGLPPYHHWNKIKSLLNINSKYDKLYEEAEREIIGNKKVMCKDTNDIYGKYKGGLQNITIPATPEAQQWEGWGTALKPANEPICMARKPLSEKTVAENVLKWGTGGINVDGCRIETDKDSVVKEILTTENTPQGRFPANVIHDGSDEVLAGFPNTKNGGQNKTSFKGFQSEYVSGKAQKIDVNETKFSNDSGSAARFFYCAKASKSERDAGCEGMSKEEIGKYGIERFNTIGKNNHPTVKPIKLMCYLCRLVTPPKGIIYDPFIGSGTTGIAAGLEDFNFIGSEIEKDSCRIAEKRIAFHRAQLKLQYE